MRSKFRHLAQVALPSPRVNAALFADGVHPNHAGYELLGNPLHEQIGQILN
jgi:lysophospholipase L1-like esterase